MAWTNIFALGFGFICLAIFSINTISVWFKMEVMRLFVITFMVLFMLWIIVIVVCVILILMLVMIVMFWHPSMSTKMEPESIMIIIV